MDWKVRQEIWKWEEGKVLDQDEINTVNSLISKLEKAERLNEAYKTVLQSYHN